MFRVLDQWDHPPPFFLHVDDVGWANRITQPAARALVQINIDNHAYGLFSPKAMLAKMNRVVARNDPNNKVLSCMLIL